MQKKSTGREYFRPQYQNIQFVGRSDAQKNSNKLTNVKLTENVLICQTEC